MNSKTTLSKTLSPFPDLRPQTSKLNIPRLVSCDFLIIGSGLAGMNYALNVCDFGKTVLICKADLASTNTFHAQGGIASVLSKQDDFEFHVRDTLIAGDGCCDEKAVRFMVSRAPEEIRDLMEFGAVFTRACDEIELGLEGGHSHHRIVHAKDQTGKEVQTKLLTKLLNEKVEIFDHHFAFELLMEDGKCCGANTLNLKTGEQVLFVSKITFLATGGAGQVFLHTTNPEIATGDGVAMAAKAGALVTDMEFIQFHPTCLYDPGNKPFLISEAVRGFGAELKTKSGCAFMKYYHPKGALAPRDIVSRAIVSEMEKSGEPCVFLDLRDTNLHGAQQCFPNIFKTCLDRGIDPFTEMIPVVPAAHYVCGGVVTDLQGRTLIPNLYAAGEVARTGVHGANRLASNSLLEAAVFSKEAAKNSVSVVKSIALPTMRNTAQTFQFVSDPESIESIRLELQQLMWTYAGIHRSRKGLWFCLNQLKRLESEIDLHENVFSKALFELKNLIVASRLIVSAALERKESRGGHFVEQKELLSPSY